MAACRGTASGRVAGRVPLWRAPEAVVVVDMTDLGTVMTLRLTGKMTLDGKMARWCPSMAPRGGPL